VLEKAIKHVEMVKKERSFYKDILQCALTQHHFLLSSPTTNPDILRHYSFDFAQQVHYPSNPLQPGPIYFLTPRKCGIFGVCCEAIPMQVNYLIDESLDVGKGANTVVSLLHHYLEHHSHGASRVHLNADNCCGQNKNNTFLQV
jgi:hypothetical protein